MGKYPELLRSNLLAPLEYTPDKTDILNKSVLSGVHRAHLLKNCSYSAAQL